MLLLRMGHYLKSSSGSGGYDTLICGGDLTVPFPSAREAEIAYGSLCVDQEPKRGGVKKILSVGNCSLQVHFETDEARKLRVAVNTFFDHLNLVVQTIEKFGPPRGDNS